MLSEMRSMFRFFFKEMSDETNRLVKSTRAGMLVLVGKVNELMAKTEKLSEGIDNLREEVDRSNRIRTWMESGTIREQFGRRHRRGR